MLAADHAPRIARFESRSWPPDHFSSSLIPTFLVALYKILSNKAKISLLCKMVTLAGSCRDWWKKEIQHRQIKSLIVIASEEQHRNHMLYVILFIREERVAPNNKTERMWKTSLVTVLFQIFAWTMSMIDNNNHNSTQCLNIYVTIDLFLKSDSIFQFRCFFNIYHYV